MLFVNNNLENNINKQYLLSYLEDNALSGKSRCMHAKLLLNNNRDNIYKNLWNSDLLSSLPTDIRKKLTRKIERLSRKSNELDIITGPIFMPSCSEKGKKYVTYSLENNKPTHYFHVVKVYDKNNSKEIFRKAYIFPNDSSCKDYSLTQFETSVTKVELAAGLIFKDISKIEIPNSPYKEKENPIAISSCIVQRNEYCLEYDFRTRNAKWVYEELNSNTLSKTVKRTKSMKFRDDKAIPKEFRGTREDYANTGLDRGHLAAADFHASSRKSMIDTFYLSNISPQIPEFNQGYLCELENHYRNSALKADKVSVITGPLYLPKEDDSKDVSYEVIGAHQIAVPTHFFKVFIQEKNGKAEIAGYLMPNRPIPKGTPLEKYKVPIERIEHISGIDCSEILENYSPTP